MTESFGLPPALAALILNEYGREVHGVAGMRSAWRLETAAGTCYLKRSATSGIELEFILGLHDYLAREAPGSVPAVIRTAAGRPFAESQGGNFVLLAGLPGVEAEYLRTPDRGTAAMGLARFHRAARGYRPLSIPGRRRWYNSWPARLRIRLGDLDRFRALAQAGEGQFDREYLRLWPRYLPQAERARRDLNLPTAEAVLVRARAAGEICHHDLAHHNVLLDGGRARFLDLDYALADTTLHDLANLSDHLLRLADWDLGPVQQILTEYGKERPLSPQEFGVLGTLLLWPQSYWQIGRQYYDERQPWPQEQFLALLDRKCGSYRARLASLRLYWREYRLETAWPD